MADLLSSAVAIVGLRYAGPPAAELVKDFLGKLLLPSADAAGKALAHPLEDWHKRRAERGHRLVLDSAARVVAAGVTEPGSVPGRLLMPILEHGSLEEDKHLYEYWVGLLTASALDANQVLPSFAAILSELSPQEAQTLNWLHEKGHPDVEALGAAGFFHDVTMYTYLITFENLHRLRLIEPSFQESRFDIDRYDVVTLTPFGIAFVDACKGGRRA